HREPAWFRVARTRGWRSAARPLARRSARRSRPRVRGVARGWRESLGIAASAGVESDRVALDIGIGFGKTLAQNLELIAKLDKLVDEFSRYPILVGASRKSFIGKILDGSPPDQRLGGSLAAATVAVWNGARIVRVHDVAETARAVRLTEALKQEL
ncbi:MAG TPA: dihydropteroate synthase, partial [Pyrinomonadaceae bacterium]|nr:dihydropteroate synthase [Pyrinomonadaceae bacterium]